MFRCDNCGSGYSMRAASSWESCPRCLAKERINVPLSFELGWRGGDLPAKADDGQLGSAIPNVGNARGATLK
jgi:hypothetical protein